MMKQQRYRLMYQYKDQITIRCGVREGGRTLTEPAPAAD